VQQQFVMVPVPADRVEEVYRLLAVPADKRPGGAGVLPDAGAVGDATKPEPVRGRVIGAQDGWTPQALETFYRQSSEAQQRFLGFLSERPDERLSLAEVSAGVGYNGRQLGGMLGGAAKRAEKLGPSVPWGWHHLGGAWTYFMPRRYAEVFVKVRNG
jgi:hypothetical protein